MERARAGNPAKKRGLIAADGESFRKGFVLSAKNSVERTIWPPDDVRPGIT